MRLRHLGTSKIFEVPLSVSKNNRMVAWKTKSTPHKKNGEKKVWWSKVTKKEKEKDNF